jgi:hypothetical protein
VCLTSIEFGLSAVATFHIRPVHLPVSVNRYVTAVWQVAAVLRWSIPAVGTWLLPWGVAMAVILPWVNEIFVVGSAIRLARSAPKELQP